MIKEYNYKNLRWIDLENPSHDEVQKIIQEFSIPRNTAEDILSPTPKQRVVLNTNCVYIVLHFPALSHKGKHHFVENERQEIDFIVGKNFLITVHYDVMKSLDKFSQTLLQIKEEESEENAGFIFHKLIKHLYHSLLHDVELIKEALHRAENSIFKGEEKKMVVELSNIHRDILRFNNALVPHRESIMTLHGIFRQFLGEQYEYFIHDMSSEYQRVDRRMQHNKALLDELRHTNDSLLSAKQNEAIKGLTMMAFVTFPLSLVATIFGMDTKTKPIVGLPYDFWIIIWIMVVIALCCLAYFNYKKWL